VKVEFKNEIKFEYSLEGSGWANVTFEISGKKFEYHASYTCYTLDQILGLTDRFLYSSVKEDFNNGFFVIDEEWREIWVHFTFEVGQNRIAELKIIEKAEGKDNIDKTVYEGTIDFFQFIRQAIASATNILKNYGLVGYSIHWGDNEFPLTSYLKTLDYFEDYHNLDYLTVLDGYSDPKFGYMRSNIYDEIKLLSRNLDPEYPKKDIYYYIYKGNLLELENFILENKSEIDKLQDDKYKYTPLICAIKAGLECCALMLIRYGANVNLSDNLKHTTLHFAVQAHSYSVAKKLIEMNKDLVNTPNEWGRTPIFENISCIKNQTKDGNDFRIFDLLLQNNVDLLHIALNKSTPLEMIKANEKHYNNGLMEYIKTYYPHVKLVLIK
jgi:hypothetical protein